MSDKQLTDLLNEAVAGNKQSENAAAELTYARLRRSARRISYGENETLTPTALVSEAWIRVFNEARDESIEFKNQLHFFGYLRQTMLHSLYDYQRRQLRTKRGGEVKKVWLDSALQELSSSKGLPIENSGVFERAIEVLERLEQQDEDLALIANWFLFSNANNTQIAKEVGVSARTVSRKKAFIRAQLAASLKDWEDQIG